MPSPPPLPRAGSRAQKQPPSSPLPPPPGQTAAAGSGGLPGCLQLAEVAQCRLITLLRTACCGCGTEAATEALHVTYRSTNRPEEGTWQGQCSTHTAVMQKGLGPASCLMPEPGRPGQRSQPPAHGGRSGLQPVEYKVCKILVSLWNKESLPGGWVTDQEPSSLESVRSRMVREVEGRTILQEDREGNCLRETSCYRSHRVPESRCSADVLSETSKLAISYCAQTLLGNIEDSVVLGLSSWSNGAGKKARDSRGKLDLL